MTPRLPHDTIFLNLKRRKWNGVKAFLEVFFREEVGMKVDER